MSSSFNIRNIREISTDPTTKFVSHLAKRISDFVNAQQTQELENKEDIYSAGQDVGSTLTFHSDLLRSNKFAFDTEYYPPFEPDGDKLRLWIRGHNVGSTTHDFSDQGNECFINGDPILSHGIGNAGGDTFYEGINTGGIRSLALRFNSPYTSSENEDYIKVTHDNRIRISEGLTTGVSIFIRIRLLDIEQEGGSDRTLFEKTDNDPITDGMQARVNSDGRLKITVKNQNITYAWETPEDTIEMNHIYDIWITFNDVGNVVKAYIDGVEQTLSSFGGQTFHADDENFDLYIMRRGQGSPFGSVYGDLYDFRLYREKVVSLAEVEHMFENKWTIADIPFGQVMVNNYWATYLEVGDSFTATSFTNSFS